MNSAVSHWGLLENADEAGSYPVNRPKATRPDVGMVLTEAGEVLISRSCSHKATNCCVAIVIGRDAPGLSRPQTERMQRAWDLALAVSGGDDAAICLQPMPHHWRFSRSDYLTIEEWQEQRAPGEPRGTMASINQPAVRR